MEQIVRIHASSGTTGKPIVTGYTRQDLDYWAGAVARLCTAAGVTAADIAQISFGYGLFTGGFGLHYGLEKLGATVVPFSSGNTERQLALMADVKTTVLAAPLLSPSTWQRQPGSRAATPEVSGCAVAANTQGCKLWTIINLFYFYGFKSK